MSRPLPARVHTTLSAALAATALAATALLAGAWAAPAQAQTNSGFTLERSDLIGETPAGLHVYVDPNTAQHGALAVAAKSISAELHRIGLPVVYAGYGNPANTDGRIEVTEGSYGCSTPSEGAADAVTVSYYGAAAGADVYMSHSRITVCPAFARSAARTPLTSALKHEFGHAMGLGHTAYVYDHHHQIMYPGLQSD
ncbi:MAG: hypothetical protein ABI429_04780, partial [Jatrophihabitantaceae bacterium]